MQVRALLNAGRYSYGAPNGDIQVTLARRGRCALLSVSNDGSPIPEEEIEKIFTPYYRIPGSDSPGSGLGMAIVREIAGQHRAGIRIHSKADGQGTVVEVSLPVLDSPGMAR